MRQQAEFSWAAVRFGAFEIDLRRGELRKHGLRIRLQEQPCKVLAALLEQPGEIVSREELVRRLWPDGTFVDFDRSLNVAVNRLRQVLGDSADQPRYVETVARRGYRFVAPVEELRGTVSDPVSSQPDKVKAKWRIAAAAAAFVLSVVVSFSLLRTNAEKTLEQITRDPGLATTPALSPDGKLLAYASDRGGPNLNIWVKQLTGDGQAVQLTHGDSDANQPSFSRDGSRIVFRSEQDRGGLYVIPAIGGASRPIAPGGRDPAFSPDGQWIAYWAGGVSGSTPDADASGAVFVIPASGGEPKRVGPNLPPAGYPVWSPDSTQLLVYANPTCWPTDADWWIVPRDGRPARKTGAFPRLRSEGFSFQLASGLPRAAAWVNDNVIFSAQKGDSRSIWQARINSPDGSVSGTPGRLTMGTALDVYPSFVGQNSLMFASLNQNIAIWSLPLAPNEGKVTGELQKVTGGGTLEVTPSMSADGRLLVYGSMVPNHEDIWLKDLRTGKEMAIANTNASESHPVITRDGSMVAYTAEDSKARSIYVAPATGGEAKRVTVADGWIFDWTLDNRSLLFHSVSSGGQKMVGVASGVVSDFLAKPGARLFQTKFSPDGQWLAFEAVFASDATGSSDSRLFIVKIEKGLPARGSEWILESDEHRWSDKPRWSPDGNMLYFTSDRDGFRCIWAQRLNPATKHPIAAPFSIYHFHKRRWSPMNAGSALLEIDIAADKLVIDLGELTGNIWRLNRQ